MPDSFSPPEAGEAGGLAGENPYPSCCSDPVYCPKQRAHEAWGKGAVAGIAGERQRVLDELDEIFDRTRSGEPYAAYLEALIEFRRAIESPTAHEAPRRGRSVGGNAPAPIAQDPASGQGSGATTPDQHREQ